MNERQRLFLVQARSDFIVFELLRKQEELPKCHALHYLQMATELFGKAYAWRHGAPKKTHRALVKVLRGLSSDREAQKQLGYGRKKESWVHLIRKAVPLAERIEDLAPNLAGDSPNPEYPWPPDLPQFSPSEHGFQVWDELESTDYGRQFIPLISSLLAMAESYL